MDNNAKLKRGETYSWLLSNEFFQMYMKELNNILEKENINYLKYEDKTISVEREERNRAEYRGSLQRLRRIIDLPENAWQEANKIREKLEKSSNRPNPRVLKRNGY